MVAVTEQKKFGFKRETSRGVPETAPDKFLAVGADSNFDYTAVQIEDDKVRGIPERFPSAPGIRTGSGSLSAVDVEASSIGDLLLGVLGSVSTSQPDGTGAPSVYEHRFTRTPSGVLPSFTFFQDRGLSAKRYPLTVIKSVEFTGAVDGKVMAAADVVFKTEEAASPFAGNFGVPEPLLFYQTEIRLGGSINVNVRSWKLTIDNQAEGLRTLNQSRDIQDVIAKGKTQVSGGFEIYFEDETERQRFLSGQNISLEIVLTGNIIESLYPGKLILEMPEIRYSAFPFGDLDGILGAAAAFNAEYNLSAQKTIEAVLTNAVAGY